MRLQLTKLEDMMNEYRMYGRSVELNLNSNGEDRILLDTSRKGTTYYETLVEWHSWEELSRLLCKYKNGSLVMDKKIKEQC